MGDSELIVCRSADLRRPLLQCLCEAAEAFGEHFVVDAHADAEMVGHLEKFAGDDGCFELCAEMLQ